MKGHHPSRSKTRQRDDHAEDRSSSDFGIGKRSDPGLRPGSTHLSTPDDDARRKAGRIFGHAGYMAGEGRAGRPSATATTVVVRCLLFEMLRARARWSETSHTIAALVRGEPMTARPSTPQREAPDRALLVKIAQRMQEMSVVR